MAEHFLHLQNDGNITIPCIQEQLICWDPQVSADYAKLTMVAEPFCNFHLST